MLFKDIHIWSSGGLYVQGSRTICAILVEGIMRNNSVNKFWFWTSGSRGYAFKRYFYLELWWPFCSAERNHMCNFGRRHHYEQYCEIILNLDQWFKRRWRLKIFLFWSSGSPFVQRSGSICAILVEGIMRNNSVNLCWIWASGSGGGNIIPYFFWKLGKMLQYLSSAAVVIGALRVKRQT